MTIEAFQSIGWFLCVMFVLVGIGARGSNEALSNNLLGIAFAIAVLTLAAGGRCEYPGDCERRPW